MPAKPLLEAQVREACDKEDFRLAATLVLEGYGPEILGYLRACSSPSLVDDSYAEFATDLWSGLPKFRWRSTMRVWAYVLARHAALRLSRAQRRRVQRELGAAEPEWLIETAARTRTPTPDHLKSEVKRRVRALRQHLSEEERSLLVLRVDKGLSWSELAHVLENDEAGDDLGRVAARLRKRFQAAKTKLRKLAEADGLLGKLATQRAHEDS